MQLFFGLIMLIICPDTEDELESATAEVSKVAQQMSSTAFSQLPESHSEAVTSSPSLGDQVLWETEAEREQELAMADCENGMRDDFPLVEPSDSKPEVVGGHGPGTDGYECVVVTAALMESLHGPDGASHLTEDIDENRARPISGGMTHMPSAATPVQAELYETQALRSMVGSCELPDQHATLQGSQVGHSGDAGLQKTVQCKANLCNVAQMFEFICFCLFSSLGSFLFQFHFSLADHNHRIQLRNNDI